MFGISFPAIMSKASLLTRTKLIFQRRPLLMNMVSFGVVYVGSELLQQIYIVKESKGKKTMDWESVNRYAVVSVVFTGPWLYYFYKQMDTFIPGISRIIVMKKLAADTIICAPITLVIFFMGMSMLERKEDVFAELKAKFWPTYKMSCCFWLPAQAINFALLPPYTRVAFVGAASFVWVNILCLVKRQEVPVAPSKVIDIITEIDEDGRKQ